MSACEKVGKAGKVKFISKIQREKKDVALGDSPHVKQPRWNERILRGLTLGKQSRGKHPKRENPKLSLQPKPEDPP